MGKFVRLAFVAPVIAVAVLASSAIAFADNGYRSISPNAELTNRVQVVVTVTYTCPSGWLPMESGITIEQAVGQEIASGQGFFSAQCTGANQTTTATVLASPSGPPFHNGPAVASGQLFVYNYSGTGPPFSGSASVNSAIQLH